MRLLFIFSLFFLLSENTHAQSLPIAIDGRYGDWTSAALELTDAANDDSGVDFLRCEVSNDENFLYLHLQLADEVNLTDNNEITIYIDTDQNANTGDFINNIGAELTINVGSKEASYDLPSGNGFLSLNDIKFRHLPSVTATEFEIAIGRNALSNAGFPLFIEDGMRIFWKDEDGPNGDQMPENGIIFTYQLDDTPTPPYQPVPLEKEGSGLVRLLTWNTLETGLDDLGREENFDRVLGVISPDIVTFNECWDINAPQVASFMNAASPLPNFQNWQAVKLVDGNVTVSRWPILQNWEILPGSRLAASLIDLPDEDFTSDLLVVNAHFRCCGADFQRQREADAFIQFILDAKTPGGVIDLPENTPFLLSGDLNLVGERRQLETLLTGDIVNSSLFGDDGPPDWDGTDLLDVISLQADQRMAFTWENTFSDFAPSRIDYHIISNSVMEVVKSYTLNTQAMSSERRSQYGLLFSDTRNASDHLPKVTDVLLTGVTPTEEVGLKKFDLEVYPNPTDGMVNVEFMSEAAGEAIFVLENMEGKTVAELVENVLVGENRFSFGTDGLPGGVYFLRMEMEGDVWRGRIIKQ